MTVMSTRWDHLDDPSPSRQHTFHSLPRTVRNFALVRYEDFHKDPGTMLDKLQTDFHLRWRATGAPQELTAPTLEVPGK
jgi:hypothetical protein